MENSSASTMPPPPANMTPMPARMATGGARREPTTSSLMCTGPSTPVYE